MAEEGKGGVKRIDASEFRDLGYLQEVNRQFFHPLGLALEVIVNGDGTAEFGGVWDYRDDQAGMAYMDGVIDPAKAARIQTERLARSTTRLAKFGYTVQPVPGDLDQ